jgi:hypothetical protein
MKIVYAINSDVPEEYSSFYLPSFPMEKLVLNLLHILVDWLVFYEEWESWENWANQVAAIDVQGTLQYREEAMGFSSVRVDCPEELYASCSFMCSFIQSRKLLEHAQLRLFVHNAVVARNMKLTLLGICMSSSYKRLSLFTSKKN